MKITVKDDWGNLLWSKDGEPWADLDTLKSIRFDTSYKFYPARKGTRQDNEGFGGDSRIIKNSTIEVHFPVIGWVDILDYPGTVEQIADYLA